MKKHSKDLKLYINQKKVRENKKILFHKEVKITFQGKATLINENKKETDSNYKIELSNNYILNRSGNYKIIYTDTNNQVHDIYFSIRKKVPIFVFLLLFVPIMLLLNLLHHEDLINHTMEKELSIDISVADNKKLKIPIYTFHMYLNGEEKDNMQTIDLMETIEKEEIISNKIAPGVKGKFIIAMDTYDSTQDLKYEIKIEDKAAKPRNLYFKGSNDIEYSSLEELANNELKGKINKNSQKNVTIQWEWKYEISDKDNQIDIEDSNKIAKYEFEITAIGKEI